MLAFRNLADPGGPGFSEAQAAAVAAESKIKDLDDKGAPIERPGRLADTFPSPFANELAAKACQWWHRAAGYVNTCQGTHLLARFPLVHL